MIVPVLGVITNIAALTVAIQAQRAVSRAMAGDQLVNEEAFSRVGTSYQSASDSLAELNSLKREFVNISKVENVELNKLSDASRETYRESLADRRQEITDIELQVAAQNELLIAQRQSQQEAKIAHMQAVQAGGDSTVTPENLQAETLAYEELKLA